MYSDCEFYNIDSDGASATTAQNSFQYADDFPGFSVHLTPSNGECLFAAIAHQMGMGMTDCAKVRKELVDFVRVQHHQLVIMTTFVILFILFYSNFLCPH